MDYFSFVYLPEQYSYKVVEKGSILTPWSSGESRDLGIGIEIASQT